MPVCFFLARARTPAKGTASAGRAPKCQSAAYAVELKQDQKRCRPSRARGGAVTRARANTRVHAAARIDMTSMRAPIDAPTPKQVKWTSAPTEPPQKPCFFHACAAVSR